MLQSDLVAKPLVHLIFHQTNTSSNASKLTTLTSHGSPERWRKPLRVKYFSRNTPSKIILTHNIQAKGARPCNCTSFPCHESWTWERFIKGTSLTFFPIQSGALPIKKNRITKVTLMEFKMPNKKKNVYNIQAFRAQGLHSAFEIV